MDHELNWLASDRQIEAGKLLLSALESTGEHSLMLAEQARALVGIDGIKDFAHYMTETIFHEVEGSQIRGALAALLGKDRESLKQALLFHPSLEYQLDGFDFVEMGGFLGVWA